MKQMPNIRGISVFVNSTNMFWTFFFELSYRPWNGSIYHGSPFFTIYFSV